MEKTAGQGALTAPVLGSITVAAHTGTWAGPPEAIRRPPAPPSTGGESEPDAGPRQARRRKGSRTARARMGARSSKPHAGGESARSSTAHARVGGFFPTLAGSGLAAGAKHARNHGGDSAAG